MSDIFKEVEEDIRRDQMKKLWDRIGLYVIGAAVLIVAGTAGFRGFEYWQEKQAESSGDRFTEAVTLSDAGDHQQAIVILEELADGGSGEYPVLAGFRIATEKAALGDESGAIAEYDAIAEARGTSDEVGNIARLRAALILMDSLSVEELEGRIGNLAATGNPWRHTAREILGLAAWRSGDYGAARDLFNQISVDEEAPRELKQRTEVLLMLIQARIGKSVSGTGADG